MLEGLDAVLAALDAELIKVQQGAMEVVDDTVNTCTQLSIDYCPVGKTGRLQQAITSDPATQVGDTIVGAAGIPDGATTYQNFVHFGHFTRNHRSFVPANPFISRAFFEVQPSFFSDMESIDL